MQKKKRLWIFLLMAALIFAAGCTSGRQESSRKIYTPNKASTEKKTTYDAQITGVLRRVDSAASAIIVNDAVSGQDMTFTYTGGTNVKTRYNSSTTIDTLEIGEIVDVYYYTTSHKATAVAVSPDSFVYNDVTKMKIFSSKNILTISGQKYQYDGGLLLWSGGESISLIDLSSQDVIKVRGIGSKIYSMVVTKGHGYLRLRNYGDFIGGLIEVGYGIIEPVMENMLIVAREGSYKVEVANGELKATERIRVERDQETELDLSAYRAEPERVGYVRFEIEPYGADLYINEVQKEYDDPIKLNYGTYSVRVTMTGYDDFKGTLTIAESTPTISISLSEGSAEVETENTPTPEPSVSVSPTPSASAAPSDTTTISDDDSTDDKTSGEKTYTDNEHTVTITKPEGVSVYVNGSLVGITPLTFSKEIGTNVIILSKTGYITKSYTVEIEDDGKDVELNFPDMIAEESNSEESSSKETVSPSPSPSASASAAP